MSSVEIARSTMIRRVDVQRWPAVPTAPNTIARVARSSRASFVTTIALLPPSSRIVRPKRDATTSATRRPTAVEPVNEMSGRRRSRSICSPTVRPGPTTSEKMPGTPWSAVTRFAMCCTAMAVSGVGSAGFQTTGSPHTAAIAAFQDQTATGKLNAVMTPTGPSGCHCSIIRWPGRSDESVSPYSWRERPTAKSQMSIISCTSPWPSARILPISSVTRSPSGSLSSRSALPRSRMRSPRLGAGRSRQVSNARADRASTVSHAAEDARRTDASGSPVVGLDDTSSSGVVSAIHPSGPQQAPSFTS